MKFNKKSITMLTTIVTLMLIITITTIYNSETKKENFSIEEERISLESPNEIVTEEPITIEEPIVWDNLTMQELTEKLDRTLTSDLTGYGKVFAEKSIELGLDPYLAVAITMHETGCKWGCSSLLKKCNNVAGIKGSPSCNGGSYKKFDSLEEGINYYLKMLYNNYYSKGLTTPELINKKYAEDKSWASKVNKYIESIKKA